MSTNLNDLEIVPSAVSKLQALSQQTGMSAKEILDLLSKSSMRYIDTANGGNINIYASKPSSGELFRVTTNPEGNTIISAGTSRNAQVDNGVASGRFQSAEGQNGTSPATEEPSPSTAQSTPETGEPIPGEPDIFFPD